MFLEQRMNYLWEYFCSNHRCLVLLWNLRRAFDFYVNWEDFRYILHELRTANYVEGLDKPMLECFMWYESIANFDEGI